MTCILACTVYSVYCTLYVQHTRKKNYPPSSSPSPHPSTVNHETLNPHPELTPHSSPLNPEPSTLTHHLSTRKTQPSTINPWSSTLPPHPTTFNPLPSFLISRPSILAPHPSTLYPHSSALKTQPLNRPPSLLHPSALNPLPTPFTPHPLTLNPQPRCAESKSALCDAARSFLHFSINDSALKYTAQSHTYCTMTIDQWQLLQ